MSWHEDSWEVDQRDREARETAWERADELERWADLLNERLTRDVGENGLRKQQSDRRAA
jgi:hypothetical protein